ncbi:hypothetical protein [Yersinia ruckeri]|uniref:PutativeTranscriptional accessory protein n=1 Tax=Yersinia ruckeri TaxID=29486 RepID=A0A0A8VIX4_YERRU|nr:hypothetical protein [Yersinia ruckeri]MCK8596518.1 hypothetical protein [Yersinia ruckeri]MCK8598017.1 hypothetical protein [Yersinia ruckeri]MCW6524872.1 hypothetical protein [Yersinia ruckeri]MCW6605396.1 hypothetical protein [Yersinia ruckeri]MCW6612461.1 hypothetical protein [Yersinia ruckeri]
MLKKYRVEFSALDAAAGDLKLSWSGEAESLDKASAATLLGATERQLSNIQITRITQLFDEDDIYPPSYKETQTLIAELMGSRGKAIPDTSENVCRTRLLRVKAGLLHLLTAVIPLIENEQQRLQVYWWTEAAHNIVRLEEHDAKKRAGAES